VHYTAGAAKPANAPLLPAVTAPRSLPETMAVFTSARLCR
jgi:hypothetical protein